MRKFVIFVIVIGGWGWSLWQNPSQWSLETIFYPPVGEERRLFEEKKGLDTSSVKRLYYNKATIYLNRYTTNFFGLLDVNSYFFRGHPREDVSGRVFRSKVFWLLILPFFSGLWRVKLGGKWLVILAVLAVLKNPDGWDLIMVVPIGLIINNGFTNLEQWWRKSRKLF